jgi:Carbohydrate esterase, sialic acid-specific acetylesterase/IPT/TIG domain
LRRLVLMPVLLAVMVPSAGGAQQPIQVFLLAGQSNMLGRAQPVTAGTPGPIANLLLYRGGSWQPAGDPLGPPSDPDSGVGPGMTFGIGVLGYEPGTTVGLIMCAQGGTPIGVWLPGHRPFDRCRQTARAAGGTVAGVVFLQGEYEALHGDANRWHARFAKVEAAFQKDFGPVPFVLGQIGNVARPYAQQVRDAQAAADAELAPVTLVSSIDLAVGPDGVHFTVGAEKTLGYRYADAWWTLLHLFPQVTGVSPNAGASGTAVTITGSRLGETTEVKFGGSPAGFVVDGPNQVTATVPDAGMSGPVQVTTPYATVGGPDFDVLPLIDSFSPTSGKPGAKVFVDGTGLAGATAVTLNGLLLKFKVVSPTRVRLKIPPQATSGSFQITTAGGTAVSAVAFTVLPK